MKPHLSLLAMIIAWMLGNPLAGIAAASSGGGTVYLFSYFINNGEDGLHLAWSRDGYRWEALKQGHSFLTPQVGESKLMRDPGFSVIDGTLLEFGGRLHLVFKDERLGPPVKKHLQIAEAGRATGPWEKLTPPFTPSWVEGPTCLKVGDEVLVYFDCYRDHHYGAMKSKDLKQWEDVTSRLAMPAGIRHGTALAVPAAVVEALRRADGSSTNARPAL